MASRPLDLTPKTHIIEAQRERDLSFPQCLSELVDNSLDAGATVIDISHDKSTLKIKDNGCGCDDIERMLRMGDHSSYSSTTSGRYGVGLKDGSQWMADEIRIRTVTHDKTSDAAVDWVGLSKSGDWNGYSEVDENINNGLPTGTEITLRRLRRKPNMAAVERALSFTFAPAIVGGISISINGSKLTPYRSPQVSDRIAFEFSVRGLIVKGFAGVTGEGEKNPYGGFNLVNHHRTIRNTSAPANGYSTGNFFSIVQLIGRWPLSRNKESIPDEDLFDDLCNELAERCADTLAKAERRSHTSALSKLRASANELAMNLFGSETRPPKPKPPRPGPPKPRPPGPPSLVSVPEGSRGTSGRRPSGLTIDFAALEDSVFAKTDVDGRRVTLNTDNAGAAALIKEGGLSVTRAAVQEYAAQSALAAHRQMEIFGESSQERYQNALGRWMAEIYRRHEERTKAA